MVMIFLLATLSAKGLGLRAWFQTYTAQSCALPPGRPTTTAQPCSALRSHSVSCHNFRWRSWWLSRCRPPSPNSNLHKGTSWRFRQHLASLWTLSMSKIIRTNKKTRCWHSDRRPWSPVCPCAMISDTCSSSKRVVIIYTVILYHCQYMLVPVILWFQAALEHPVTVGLEDLWTIL